MALPFFYLHMSQHNVTPTSCLVVYRSSTWPMTWLVRWCGSLTWLVWCCCCVTGTAAYSSWSPCCRTSPQTAGCPSTRWRYVMGNRVCAYQVAHIPQNWISIFYSALIGKELTLVTEYWLKLIRKYSLNVNQYFWTMINSFSWRKASNLWVNFCTRKK